MNPKHKTTGLGRGLNDIHEGLDELLTTLDHAESSAVGQYAAQHLPVDKIQPGAFQPRRVMDADSLQELAQSIRQHGILQPLIVRSIAADRYELIAGERRWQAAKLADYHEVPVLVRDISDETAMAMGIIENVQREDLNVMDQAIAMDRLLTEFGMTHEQVATSIGKSRVSVTNILRLLHLDDEIKQWVSNGDLSMGQARCLLALSGTAQRKAAETIKTKALSVRASEALVARMKAPALTKAVSQSAACRREVEQWREALCQLIDLPVTIRARGEGRGTIQIEYEHIDQIRELLVQFQPSSTQEEPVEG